LEKGRLEDWAIAIPGFSTLLIPSNHANKSNPVKLFKLSG
jgi:hypothetical protein